MASERRRRVPQTLMAALLCFSAPAWAEPDESQKESARNLMAEGRELREAQDLRGALVRFQTADEIMGVPTTAYEVAATQAELAMLVEARATLRRLLAMPVREDDPEPFRVARTRARQLDAELAERQAVQDREARAAAKPEVASSLASSRPADARAPAAAPADAAPGRSIPTLTYVGGGVAIVGLAVGSAAGIAAISKKHAAEANCAGNQCPPAAWSDLDSAHDLAIVSTLGFVACGVGVTLGVGALVFGQDASKSSASLQLVARPRQVSLTGRF